MKYAVSDLHGMSIKRFRALLETAGFTKEDTLYVIGDVIDRGEHGAELLTEIMNMPGAVMIMGNHEAMMLECSFLFDEITEETIDEVSERDMEYLVRWMRNGAEPTIRGLQELKARDIDTFRKLIEWVEELPFWAVTEAGGRTFCLTHAGFGNFDKDRRPVDYTERDLIWNRPKPTDRYYEDMFTVFGHTPVSHLMGHPVTSPVITDTWADIDMGIHSGGTPAMLRLDDMKVFSLSAPAGDLS